MLARVQAPPEGVTQFDPAQMVSSMLKMGGQVRVGVCAAAQPPLDKTGQPNPKCQQPAGGGTTAEAMGASTVSKPKAAEEVEVESAAAVASGGGTGAGALMSLAMSLDTSNPIAALLGMSGKLGGMQSMAEASSVCRPLARARWQGLSALPGNAGVLLTLSGEVCARPGGARRGRGAAAVAGPGGGGGGEAQKEARRGSIHVHFVCDTEATAPRLLTKSLPVSLIDPSAMCELNMTVVAAAACPRKQTLVVPGATVPASTASPPCAPGCAAAWRGDGVCDAACAVAACALDGGDCTAEDVKMLRSERGECAPGCRLRMRGDGVCDAACRSQPACDHDGTDCLQLPGLPRPCAAACPPSLQGDGVCDRGCDVPGCAHDLGDCAARISAATTTEADDAASSVAAPSSAAGAVAGDKAGCLWQPQSHASIVYNLQPLAIGTSVHIKKARPPSAAEDGSAEASAQRQRQAMRHGMDQDISLATFAVALPRGANRQRLLARSASGCPPGSEAQGSDVALVRRVRVSMAPPTSSSAASVDAAAPKPRVSCAGYGRAASRTVRLMDPQQPALGLEIEYGGGAPCNGGARRTVRFSLHCRPHADPLARPVVLAHDDCRLHIALASVAACPLPVAKAAVQVAVAGSCAAQCARRKIGDGTCDAECNSASCVFDGGDCYDWSRGRAANASLRCAAACPTAWLANGHCDVGCDVEECWYDGGDCQAPATAASSTGAAEPSRRGAPRGMPAKRDLPRAIARAAGVPAGAIYGGAPDRGGARPGGGGDERFEDGADEGRSSRGAPRGTRAAAAAAATAGGASNETALLAGLPAETLTTYAALGAEDKQRFLRKRHQLLVQRRQRLSARRGAVAAAVDTMDSEAFVLRSSGKGGMVRIPETAEGDEEGGDLEEGAEDDDDDDDDDDDEDVGHAAEEDSEVALPSQERVEPGVRCAPGSFTPCETSERTGYCREGGLKRCNRNGASFSECVCEVTLRPPKKRPLWYRLARLAARALGFLMTVAAVYWLFQRALDFLTTSEDLIEYLPIDQKSS